MIFKRHFRRIKHAERICKFGQKVKSCVHCRIDQLECCGLFNTDICGERVRQARRCDIVKKC